jgi:hypothetical protein
MRNIDKNHTNHISLVWYILDKINQLEYQAQMACHWLDWKLSSQDGHNNNNTLLTLVYSPAPPSPSQQQQPQATYDDHAFNHHP